VVAHDLEKGNTAAAVKRAQRLGQETVLAREENARALGQVGRWVTKRRSLKVECFRNVVM
jgi:hypothetical protein